MTTDLLFHARIQHILETAVDGLPEEDRAERIEHCQRTGEHGVRMQPDADGITFMWGGRTLAVADMAVFDDDAYFSPMRSTFVSELPDDPRDPTDPAPSTPDEPSSAPDDEDPARPQSESSSCVLWSASSIRVLPALSAVKGVGALSEEGVGRPQNNWPCRYFSVSLPFGEGQGDVAALLRRAADSIDRLAQDGEPEILGLMYTDDEVNENGDWPSITVFYTLES